MKKMLIGVLAFALATAGQAATYTVNSGETFEVTDALNVDGTTIQAYDGAVIKVSQRDVYARIWANGSITVSNTFDSVREYIWICNGVRVVTDTDPNATLTIARARNLHVGRASISSSLSGATYKGYPPIDVKNLVFTEPGAGGIVLRRKSTVRTLPDGVPVSVMDEPNENVIVALQSTKSVLPFLSSEPNALNLTHYDVEVCTMNSLPKGCRVNVPVGRTFTFRPSTVNAWTWNDATVETGIYRVNLAGRGARVCFRGTGTTTTCRSDIGGRGEVVVQSDKSEFRAVYHGRTFVSSSPADLVVVDVDDDRVPPPDDGWKRKVAHWFDADKAGSVIKFTYASAQPGWENVRNEYEGHPIVIGWADAVTGTDGLFLYNNRIWTPSNGTKPEDDYVLQVMPYLVEGGLNGRNYVSCGCLAKNTPGAKYDASGKLVAVSETRRLRVWQGGGSGSSKPSSGSYRDFGTTPYCIMVYNSANGGGKALLGTDGVAAHGNLARNTSDTQFVWTAYPGFSMCADGVPVNPMNERPSGGWQVLSLDMTATNTVVNAIGRHQSDGNSGGQDYAEIIFFSEKPTDAERAACERYLAEKWGLTQTYVRTVLPGETLVGKSGGTVELRNSLQPDGDSSAVVTLAGDFRGRIVVPEGRTLVLADKPAPPTEADIPSVGRVGWFDPSLEGAVELNPADSKGVHVEKLWGRDLDGLLQNEGDYWLSGQHSANATGRCAGKSGRPDGVWPLADDLTWLDYAHKTGGNTMRFHNSLKTATTSTVGTPLNTREGFLVLDTSLGGGNPVGTDVGFTQNILPRDGGDVDAPIWSAANTVTMSGTWLDTTQVDGTTHGFNGRGEVLTYQAATTLPVAFFGFYNGNVRNFERMGEILLYDRVLEDDERRLTQEYLMYKWLGDLNGRYSDLSGASVSGAGTVRSATLAALPRYEADFSGATEVSAEALSVKGGAPVAVVGDLSFPNLKAVSVATKEPCVLATATGSITLPAEKVAVTFAGGGPGYLSVDGGALTALPRTGMLIIVK